MSRSPWNSSFGTRGRARSQRKLRLERLESRDLLAVVINEIHYAPDLNTEQVEFLELYNAGGAPVSLDGWRIDEAVDHLFDAGATIDAFDYFVVAQDAADFQAKFGFAPDAVWEVGDKLSNEGETIELRDAADALVDVVSYKPGFPWPTSGDYGSSIELINPQLDNDLSGSWRSSGITSTPNAGETLVVPGSTWSYRKGITANPPEAANDPAHNWKLTGFVTSNDAVAWQDGAASIGYGDGDDATVLSDMRFNYSSFYARHSFIIDGNVPDALALRMYVDDGAIVSINGVEVERFHVTAGVKNYDSLSGESHDVVWEEVLLTGASQYLVAGENTIAVHVLNTTLGSSDASFNVELGIPDDAVGQPTPGAQNSVFAANAAPQLRQLKQSVLQPASGQDVTISIKATDPDGVQSVQLEYQAVDPGAYTRLTDPDYETNWTTVAMFDNGLNGDAVAGDSVYTVVLPGSLQTHRRLVRYRITATDALRASVRAPYADDGQPNFAYFVYDGVPDHSASLRPGVLPTATYDGAKLDDIATYHLIADSLDVTQSQYNPSYNEVQFHGTLVYNGVVYDHILFRNRGQASTYQVGKNKWKLKFNRGHYFQAYDDYGVPYKETWDDINILPGTNPWWRNDVSTDGTVLFEPVAFKLYELAGAPAPATTYFNFRVIDGVSEVAGSQYNGDYWGLYIGIEQPDGSFLDERDLPDGNIYNMQGSAFGATSQRHQGSDQPTDRSDLVAFLDGVNGTSSLQWWEDNLDWDSYFAWNLINFAANNSDIRVHGNVNYYHNQDDDKWYVIPWDLDLTFEDAPHHGSPIENRENLRTLIDVYPAARLAYENRLREITDLLLANGDAAGVVQEFANILTLQSGDTTLVDANQAQWDYHPSKVKKGIWYDNFNPALLPSETFAGLVQYMEDYLSPGGYGYNLMTAQGNDADIPATPTISYVGAGAYPADSLVFQTTPYSDPQGAATFAQMEWRVAQVANPSTDGHVPGTPYAYEIEGTWESGELDAFASQISVPASAIQVGETYRARVRMQDSDGHWSHWSAAEEFVAGPNAATPALAITELHYNPASNALVPNEQDLEFIELMNTGAQTIDLQGVQLTSFASTPYTFGAGLSLAPGQRIVVAKDPTAFETFYGTGVLIAPDGYGSANLSNGGETIALVAASGATIQSITYDDKAPWPALPDGDGPSLEIIDPLGAAEDPANWRASAALGGSPGWDGVVGLPGDYNGDNAVDGGDFLAWQRSYGTRTPALTGADGSGNLEIDAPDLAVWGSHFGESTPPAQAAFAVAELEFPTGPFPVLGLTPVAEPSSAAAVSPSPAPPTATVARLRYRQLDAAHAENETVEQISRRRRDELPRPSRRLHLEGLTAQVAPRAIDHALSHWTD